MLGLFLEAVTHEEQGLSVSPLLRHMKHHFGHFHSGKTVVCVYSSIISYMLP